MASPLCRSPVAPGGGTRVVLGMVQADRARVSDFGRSDGSLPHDLVVRAEVRPVIIAMPPVPVRWRGLPAVCPVALRKAARWTGFPRALTPDLDQARKASAREASESAFGHWLAGGKFDER